MMKKKLFVLIVVLLAVSMVSMPAFAGKPQEASGTWWYRPSQPNLTPRFKQQPPSAPAVS